MPSRSDFYPHQHRGVEFLTSRPAAALWWDMGLFKTITALTAVVDLMNDFATEKTLVVAPKRVAESVWHREAANWDHTSHLTVARAVGNEKARRAAIEQNAAVTVINRENVPWLVKGCKWQWDTVILDESHAFKSRSSLRWRALRAVRKKVDRIIELTGTPSPNKLLDLWAQIYLLDEGQALGKTLTGFRDKFFYSDYMGYNWTPHAWAEAEIYKRLEHLATSLKGDDVVSLPDRVDNLIWVDLPAAAAKQYREFEKTMILRLNDAKITAQNAAVLTGKLGQAANGFLYRDGEPPVELHRAKLDALQEIIDGQDGRPVLVAYHYKEDLRRILKEFPKAKVLEGLAEEEAWNRGEIEVLLAHPASAGEGLNLQHGGSTMVWYGIPWSLGTYLQFNKRLHRKGQKDTVVIHHLLARGTVDETVLRALNSKHTTQEALLAALRDDMKDRA